MDVVTSPQLPLVSKEYQDDPGTRTFCSQPEKIEQKHQQKSIVNQLTSPDEVHHETPALLIVQAEWKPIRYERIDKPMKTLQNQ